MKRQFGRKMLVALCAILPATAAVAVWGQSGSQSAAMDDVRHPQSQQMQAPGLSVVPEDLSAAPLAAGYFVSVTVFGAPDVSGLYEVDLSGNMTLPLVGSVHVAGLSIAQTETKIASALKTGDYILHPSVTLTIQGYVPTYVTISGEVQMPGRYPLLAPHSLQQVIALAGGTTLFSSGSAEITRVVQGKVQAIDLPMQSGAGGAPDQGEVKPGDQVTVKRAGVVYVLGAVFRPGGYIMQENGQLDVVQAIAVAAGTTMQASMRSIRVVRRDPNGSVLEIPVNYSAMLNGKELPMVLRPQDVVYVPVSKAKAALTGTATNILGATSSAAIYAAH